MPLKYEHLKGLDFDIEKQNCYTIMRMFYKDNYGIELSDYACPNDWWDHGGDLYNKLAASEGFSVFHGTPREYRAGDIIIMAIQSSTGNHAGIVLDNGEMLHHLVGQRSIVTSYGGMFRNATVAVYRHRDVPPPEELQVNLKDVLPEHVLRRLKDLEESNNLPAEEVQAGA